MGKNPLSVAIITKNESHNLPDCLKSVAFADQVVVVDTGSTDGTEAIAKEFGCDFFIEEWKGFGSQKQSAIDKCNNEWVLLLDADERIPPETASVICSVVLNSKKESAAGCSFMRKNFFYGRWIKHMGWWPDRVVRLFRTDLGKMSNANVHEAVEVEGRIENLTCCIEHFTETDLKKILLKIDQYSTLGAEQSFAAGKRSSILGAFSRAGIAFLQNYALRLGFLDGSPGLILATTDSINKFFKYAKLWQLSRTAEHRR